MARSVFRVERERKVLEIKVGPTGMFIVYGKREIHVNGYPRSLVEALRKLDIDCENPSEIVADPVTFYVRHWVNIEGGQITGVRLKPRFSGDALGIPMRIEEVRIMADEIDSYWII